MEAVVFATNNQLPNLQFATNSRGEPDVAIFDFTTMYASENSCRALERKGHKLLLGLVGDSLLEVKYKKIKLVVIIIVGAISYIISDTFSC